MKNNHKNIQLKWIIIFVLSIFNLSIAQKKVIAYIPNWIDLNTFSKTIQYNKLTHINIAFENPDANGYLTFNIENNTIINAALAQKVKVFVSLGGGSVSEGGTIRDNYFNLIKPSNRTAFIQKIYDYVVAHNFDGVDVDLEGPAINSDYEGFVIALGNKLHENGKLISAALSEGYGGSNVPSSTFETFDWINIMAYDATGPWTPNNPGQHSPYNMAVNQFKYWTERGLRANKAIIGLPFYGYGFGALANQGISYANIINQYPGAENGDQVGNTIYYNGIPTIKQKTAFAIQNSGGVMIWELSQDATGSKSLLTAIDQVVNPNQPQLPSTDVITVYNECNYEGFSGGLTIGDYDLTRLKSLGILDDDISSIKISEGFQAILYQDDNFNGTSTVINSDNSCLDVTWNNKVSSVRILANGNTSIAKGAFYLQNKNSGMNMSILSSSTEDGANVVQNTPNTEENQKFTFTHLGNGLYKIIANHSSQSLNINNFSKDNGANVGQNPYIATSNQQFILVATGDGFYKIISSNSGKLVEVVGASTVNDANVQQWENTNQTCGQWKLIPINPIQPSILIQSEDYSDMNGIQVEATSDVGGGFNVGYADTGDWMSYYNINFPTTGSYLFEYRVASSVTGAKISSNLNANEIFLGNIDIRNTGGWQNWDTVSSTATITAGTYNFKIFIENSGVNINWIRITALGGNLDVKTISNEVTTSNDFLNLNIYPNPTDKTLFFTAEVSGANVSIIDSGRGAILSSQKINNNNNNSIDVSVLKTGIYLILVEKDGIKTARRFIKK